MKKRSRVFLAKKAEDKKNVRGLKKGQGRIIGNQYVPEHYHKIGIVVDIVRVTHNGEIVCYDKVRDMNQYVNPKDIAIKE
ncbi:hypothetical protein [Bacillus cereus]|uniref:hypothetical protein n=1 Tax=Bacillus cereus TaxID=1396 RepID=UPI0039813BE8